MHNGIQNLTSNERSSIENNYNHNRKLTLSQALLYGRAQGTSFFTSAASYQKVSSVWVLSLNLLILFL